MTVSTYDEIPVVNEQRMSKESMVLMDIAMDRMEGMCLEYESVEEAINRVAIMTNYRNRHRDIKELLKTNIIRRKNKVYITKEKKSTVLQDAEEGNRTELERLLSTVRKKYEKAMVDGTVKDPEMWALEKSIAWLKETRKWKREQERKKLWGGKGNVSSDDT